MPFNGFTCTVTGTHVSPDDCLTCAAQGGREGADGLPCPLSAPVLRGIIENAQPRGLQAYSATELAGCPRQVVLQDQVPYDVDPEQAYWLFRGTLGHQIVEAYTHGDAIVEQRLYATLNGMLLTGQPDVVYPDRRLVVDYKTTKRVPRDRKIYTCPDCGAVLRDSQWKARKRTQLTCPDCERQYRAGDLNYATQPPVPYDTHVSQLSIYRWLLHENGIAVEFGEIAYLSMARTLRLPVELWPLERTENYLAKRLQRLLDTGPDGLPCGVWDEPDAQWRCDYCAVKDACLQHYREQGRHAAVAALG